MLISAIGNDRLDDCAELSQWRGFTLLEIMLVLLIVAVMAALVVPNMFVSGSARADDEARRLQQTLRLAVSEAMLTGVPIRWTGYATGYVFEQPDAEGEWHAMTERPFSLARLPAGVQIGEVRGQAVMGTSLEKAREGERPVLGRLVLMPDGMLTQADIVLLEQGERERVVDVRPGPGGVRLEDAD